MAVILKTVSLGPARRKGQNRIESVQGLDSSLFVYAKDGGMIRRVQIKADNVGGLLLKVGILAQHVRAQPVRLKAVASPNPRNGHVIGAKGGGQPTAAPVVVPSRGPRRVRSNMRASSFAASGRTYDPDDALPVPPAGSPESALSSAAHKRNYTSACRLPHALQAPSPARERPWRAGHPRLQSFGTGPAGSVLCVQAD